MAKQDPWLSKTFTGSNQLIRTGRGTYGGYTIRETAGATAVVRIWDNTSASGTLLETFALAANGSAAQEYNWGVAAQTGIYVEIVSGTVEGSIRTA